MLIDTHAHINFRAFKDDAKEVLERSLGEGVGVINIGSQIDTSRQAVELADWFSASRPSSAFSEGQSRAGVYACVGLHPEHTHSQYVDEEEAHFLTREEEFDYEAYKQLAQNPKVVGIGECGLDYYRLPEGGSHGQIKEKQKAAFRQQVKLAKELNKTLVVHSRSAKGTNDAVLDILEILRQEYGTQDTAGRFVVHSFTGSPEIAQEFYNLGGYISFNGIITFDKTGNMEKLVKSAPLDRIVVETDCPYLTPVPNRGKRNEPVYVKHVAEKLSAILGLPVAEISGITVRNSHKLFQLT